MDGGKKIECLMDQYLNDYGRKKWFKEAARKRFIND